VHQITNAWQTLPNGMAGAGAGMKIGMLDSGIDINHPGFQGFSTAIPQGFPIVSDPSETANTNNKVIVVRDYTGDGGLDAVVGHGTGTAMVAAGVTNSSGLPGVGPLTGAAPAAWLGNYRVIDDTGSGQESWFLAALNDAVNDGMNVVNYSAGGPDLQSGTETTGPEARAIAAAVTAGTVVVIAAGNNGPQPGTIGDPAVVSAAISAGANENERYFDFAVTLGTLPPYEAFVPSSEQGVIITPQVSGPATDVTALDGNGYGCAGFPNGSLTGQIALISRGGPGGNPCTFDTKLNNAENAGAAGAVVYDNISEDLIDMSLATATLPATFVSQSSGQNMLMQLGASPGLTAIIDFTGFVPFPQSSDLLASFSSRGPTPGGGLKPDLLAVGDWVVTAYTTLDPNNPGPPYQLASGTSFSTPLVTGSLAVLMAARPGLTAAQYSSLIINTAPPLANADGTPVTPQMGGAGKMNLLRAIQNSLAASPTSVDFQTAAGTINAAIPVSFTNIGTVADTFTVVVNPINTSGPVPTLDVPTFTLAPGASQTVSVQMAGSGLPTGAYHGFLSATGTQTSVATRVPYWFGVPGSTVQNISVQSYDPGPYCPGDMATIIIRSTDVIGLPLDAGVPVVSVTGARSRVSVVPSGNIPGTYEVDVQIGRPDSNGLNAVTISTGGISQEIDLSVND
jgi:minor extracellular serine protease Vpr